MEERETSPEYQKGLDQMYLLARHEPELAKQIMTADHPGDRFDGMKAGYELAEMELAKEREQLSKEDLPEKIHANRGLPGWLKDGRHGKGNSDKTQSKDLDKDVKPEL